MGNVIGLAACVHDHENMVATICQHQVVQNTAGVIGEKTVALSILIKSKDINGYQRLQRGCHHPVIRALDDHLPHVTDVKEPSFVACMQVFLQDAHRVLNGHGVARERHHFGTECEMKVMQRRMKKVRHQKASIYDGPFGQ